MFGNIILLTDKIKSKSKIENNETNQLDMQGESASLQEIFGKTMQGSTKSFTPSKAAK